MNVKKAVYLFLALLLPVFVFLFLRTFGKNEFAVKPLYSENFPSVSAGCTPVRKLPYILPDSIIKGYSKGSDSLSVVFFGAIKDEAANQFRRVQEELRNDGVAVFSVEDTVTNATIMRCFFFLKNPFDVVLFDTRGGIRGNYTSGNRDEIDRLLTEVTIIQKRY
ncbi:MAG: hypothetical protein WKF87_19750 [Chryseolinea sp.]